MVDDESESSRRHPRVSTELPVRISTIEPEQDPRSGKPFFRASAETCANVSRGGAFVLTSEPLAPGRRVLIEMLLPDGSAIEAVGRVAWSKRSMTAEERRRLAGVGVEFLGGAPEQFDALDRYISKRIDA